MDQAAIIDSLGHLRTSQIDEGGAVAELSKAQLSGETNNRQNISYKVFCFNILK